MPELSPAAQAIKAAVLATYDSRVRRDDALWRLEQPGVVAALRAAADHGENLYDPHEGKVAVVRVDQLRTIATELAGDPDPITTEPHD